MPNEDIEKEVVEFSEEEESKEEKKATKAKGSKEPISVDTGALVTVKLKNDMKFRVGQTGGEHGDGWWDLKQGVCKVPRNVRQILFERNMLEAI